MLPLSQVRVVGSKAGLFVGEERFHDEWADSEDCRSIDVRGMNEAVTAPEMRFIHQMLGDITGKKILDLGCGLGEASVYFALKGASVTAVDLSEGMLNVTKKLAAQYAVSVQTHKSSAETLGFPSGTLFDVIYAGNLFHHVEIDRVLCKIMPYLKEDGVLVSWDPATYNPLINVYRKIVVKTRTFGEHPLTFKDLQTIKNYFTDVHIEWFWLSTLMIFLVMYFVERCDPNRERYWKKVVRESDKWARLYRPLEALDKFLLRLFPFLKPFCWNVVMIARRPK